MLIPRIQQDIIKRQKEYDSLSPYGVTHSIHLMNSININKERPLKSNSSNLSFKGLSFMYRQANKIPYSASEILKYTEQTVLGNLGNELFNHVKNSKYTKNLVKVEGDSVTFFKKSIPQLIFDGMIYPVKILPADLLNGIVKVLGKIKPLEAWSKKVLNTSMFKNIRQRSKINSEVNSLRGIFEKTAKLQNGGLSEAQSDMFRTSVKMFDPKTGNYDTKHERSLNRLVSGLPPALFLANDAYNLSRMMDDDPKAAEKEKKTRFKQETARIGFSAYLTLITMGALQKFINNSKMGVVLMTGSTVLVTEMISRLINGKHIVRLSPDKAREINKKNNAKEAEIAPVKTEETSFTHKKENENKETKQQKPLLSFSTLMKASAGIIAAGYAVKFARLKISAFDNLFKNAAKMYKKNYGELTEIPHFTMEQERFYAITQVLEKNGFTKLAEKYKDVAKTALNKDGLIDLGARNKKVKPLVDFVIAPFKFAWNTITLPYKLSEKLFNMFNKSKPKPPMTDIKALATSIDKIGREALSKNYSPEKFKTFVSDNILKGFNVDTMSNISNSQLSNLAKTSATAATIWFLMTDNYNMVMLKSNGNDVDGAKTKFKERFVQEGSRLFYQTLLIDLFNSTFSNQYHASLLGMSWITLTNTTLGEWLTRKSVGTPVKQHTRNELIEIEDNQNNAKGFVKGYYNFMRRLTGKRPIKTYEVVNNTETVKTEIVSPAPVNFESRAFKEFIH